MNIKNVYIFKNSFNLALLQSLAVLFSVLYLETALAASYKCIDKNNNVTYSDQPCLNKTRQKLDIVVPPVDKASAERLEYYKQHGSSNPNTSNKITTIEDPGPSKRCDGYAKALKGLKNKLKAGYEPDKGEAIRESIKQSSKDYNDCVNK